jgi:hypothetical protein
MTQLNPLTGSILQSAQVSRQQAATKAAHVRRAQQLQKNVAQRDDELEHQVESSEQVAPTKDQEEHPAGKKRKQQGKPADEKPHIDLTA